MSINCDDSLFYKISKQKISFVSLFSLLRQKTWLSTHFNFHFLCDVNYIKKSFENSEVIKSIFKCLKM